MKDISSSMTTYGDRYCVVVMRKDMKGHIESETEEMELGKTDKEEIKLQIGRDEKNRIHSITIHIDGRSDDEKENNKY